MSDREVELLEALGECEIAVGSLRIALEDGMTVEEAERPVRELAAAFRSMEEEYDKAEKKAS